VTDLALYAVATNDGDFAVAAMIAFLGISPIAVVTMDPDVNADRSDADISVFRLCGHRECDTGCRQKT
jgi:hypothetical protein